VSRKAGHFFATFGALTPSYPVVFFSISWIAGHVRLVSGNVSGNVSGFQGALPDISSQIRALCPAFQGALPDMS